MHFAPSPVALLQEAQPARSVLKQRTEGLGQSDNLSNAFLTLLRFVRRIYDVNRDSLKKRAKKRLSKPSLKGGIYEKMWIEIVVPFKHCQCFGRCEASNKLQISCVAF